MVEGVKLKTSENKFSKLSGQDLRKLGLRNAGPALSPLGHAAGSGLESALVRRSLLNVHKWPLGGTVYTIAIHIHSGKINSSCPYKFIEFQL